MRGGRDSPSAQHLDAEIEEKTLLLVAARTDLASRGRQQHRRFAELPVQAQVHQGVRIVRRVSFVDFEQALAPLAAGVRHDSAGDPLVGSVLDEIAADLAIEAPPAYFARRL